MKSIASAIISFLIVIFACLPAGAEPSDGIESVKQGKNYFDSGNYRAAYDRFLTAFQTDPGNLDINFYLGRAAFEIGNYEMALMAFERILIVQPDAMRVKLEMARTFLKLGLRDNAELYFRKVLSQNPPETVRKNIEKFLANIAAAEKQHFISGIATLGFDWNDNVRVAPTSDLVQTLIGDVLLTESDTRPQEDTILSMTSLFNYTYKRPDSPLSWKTTAAFFESFYHNERDLNVVYFGLSSGPDITFKKQTFGIHAILNHLDLGYYRYLYSAGAEITFAWVLSTKALIHISSKIEDKIYSQTHTKDAFNLGFSLGPSFSIGSNRIGVSFSKEYENARDDSNSFQQYSLKFTLERKLPFKVTLFGGYEYEHSTYKQSEDLFSDSRQDNIHYVDAGLSQIIWQSSDSAHNLSWQINYQHTVSDSSIGLYEYKHNVISLSVSYAY